MFLPYVVQSVVPFDPHTPKKPHYSVVFPTVRSHSYSVGVQICLVKPDWLGVAKVSVLSWIPAKKRTIQSRRRFPSPENRPVYSVFRLNGVRSVQRDISMYVWNLSIQFRRTLLHYGIPVKFVAGIYNRSTVLHCVSDAVSFLVLKSGYRPRVHNSRSGFPWASLYYLLSRRLTKKVRSATDRSQISSAYTNFLRHKGNGRNKKQEDTNV